MGRSLFKCSLSDLLEVIGHRILRLLSESTLPESSYADDVRTFLFPPDASYITTTVYGDGPSTTYTFPPQGTPPIGTVFPRLPYGPITSMTTTGPFPTAATRTLMPDDPGDPITVLIEQPDILYTTLTRTGQVTVATTRTLQPGSGGEKGTVIIDVPQEIAQYTTLTRTGTSTSTIPITSTQPPGGPGQTGTVIVDLPLDFSPFITTTEYGTMTAPTTTTRFPNGPGQSGTIIVNLPQPYITTVRGSNIPNPTTIT